MTVLDDRYGDTWSVLASDPETGRHDFLRPRDGATLHVNPSGITLTYPPSSPVYVTTLDPMGWLAETFGFPKMNLGGLEAIRRRERLDAAFREGMEAQWWQSRRLADRPAWLPDDIDLPWLADERTVPV